MKHQDKMPELSASEINDWRRHTLLEHRRRTYHEKKQMQLQQALDDEEQLRVDEVKERQRRRMADPKWRDPFSNTLKRSRQLFY